MYTLYYWPTPNGHKITMMLEELGLDYEIRPVDIQKGEQFAPEFLAVAPNNKIPALVDGAPADGGGAYPMFESGAILLYLAEKHGRFLPPGLPATMDVVQWLFWQVAGLGPMLGQNHHFVRFAPVEIEYAITRYVNETNRLYGVLDRRLGDSPYVAGPDYTIADIAIYPWIVPWRLQRQDITQFPNLHRWFGEVHARPATAAAYAKGQPHAS